MIAGLLHIWELVLWESATFCLTFDIAAPDGGAVLAGHRLGYR